MESIAEAKEVLPQYNEIVQQNAERQEFDFDNFLSPERIQDFNNVNYENSAKILTMWKSVEIWKPDPVVLPYKVFKDVIEYKEVVDTK